ncbi:MAG: MltA domain-containing protein [Pseudomonadota bacterium]|nr:MltA domain-containing protein [Desulfobacterales bacterium]MBL6967363.1 MltA domain-containing protein [Desulfobacteraceae bacterium]MBL7101346.1 MltA domain-containing protein [Desulfobacteraceae bacterium]MBL7171598.1 MltA domain-containing protein [Desulfobacteraceae bacterium]MBU0733348.1 MltA domain-containing protein [Pseudomonadota bacterium]
MTVKMTHFKALFLIISITFLACHPVLKKEAQHPEESLAPVWLFYPAFRDDMDKESLILAIRRNLEYLNRLDPEEPFQYGTHTFTCNHVRESQEAFLNLITKNPDPVQLDKEIRENFLVLRATGRPGNDQVLFTGYFEPVFEASLTPDGSFKYPIYRKPDDLSVIDLSLFKREFEGKKIIARIEGKKLLPYFSRRQIDEENVLNGQGLEIAWLKDPVDVIFLQIQGSGQMRLQDGSTISVGYSASNGLAYRSIGRYMLDRGFLSTEEMSMQSIRKYLSEHPETVKDVLYYNPSYIFFQRLETGPLGNISVPLTPGRSLALDSRLFPKGALAFVLCKKPIINNRGEITKWNEFSRFVLNQDTGGAIKGAGRADIFWGNGPYAEMVAGHLRHDGELYILIKKPSL